MLGIRILTVGNIAGTYTLLDGRQLDSLDSLDNFRTQIAKNDHRIIRDYIPVAKCN